MPPISQRTERASTANPFRERLEMEIDVATLAHHIEEGNASDKFTILDVRSREDFARGHVPGAVSFPYEELKKSVDEVPREKSVITYCYHIGCLLGTRAAAVLTDAGYDVRDMLGGFEMWREKQSRLIER